MDMVSFIGYKGTPLIAPSLALVMETLDEIQTTIAQYTTFLKSVERMSASMFHNDLKRDNVMQKNGLPILIDFDLAHASKIRIAVSAGATLDFDFESHGLAIPAMRTYYDLFYYTMSIPASHPWYASIFLTLHDLFIELQPLFERLLAELSEKARTEIPLEVLVREESVAVFADDYIRY